MMIILCIYLILALFDSSLAGDSGRSLGNSLRASFGGALIVLLLFLLYLCIASLMEFRIPLLPRQILGTLQLYISFAFMLGLLKETGWDSEAVLFMPGALGHGLAKFFVLNIGTFITLILVIGSFILSAYLYGSKILRVSLPPLPSLNPISIMNMIRRLNRSKRAERVRRRRERDYHEDGPEDILFNRSVNVNSGDSGEGINEGLNTDFYFDSIDIPKFKNAQTESGHEAESKQELEHELKHEPERITEPQNPVEVFDSLLAILDTAPVPEKKKAKTSLPPRKIRRPLRTSSYESELESESESSHNDSILPPPIEIFGPAPKLEMRNNRDNISDEQGNLIISTLKGFDVNASIAETVEGASVIQYKLELSPGTKVSKVSELDGELAMALAVMSVRIEAPIPGTRYAGIEVPKKEKDRKIITLRSIIDSDEFRNSTSRLPLSMGVQIDGKVIVHGLDEFQHIVITGSKGSGKSMFINSCILSMCSVRRPEELRLILIDTRHVEFAVYDSLPHMLSATVNDDDAAYNALSWAVHETEKRTENFTSTRTRNLAAYNRKLPKDKRLPEIVIVIDELADLIYSSGREIDDLIIALAQKAGVCGIHMIISTQRPEIIIDPMSSNIPVRATFTLSSSSKNSSKNNSSVDDAFKLTGKGDMLFRDSGSSKVIRVQTPFISEERIADFVDYMNNSLGNPNTMNFN